MRCLSAISAFLATWLMIQPAVAEEETGMATDAKINFFYVMCNNVDEMRAFYSDILGLKETFYNPPPEGWLGYDAGGVEVMFCTASDPLPVLDTWSSQPGWEGGELETFSWSARIPNERFAEVINQLKRSGAPTWAAKPMWRLDNYWCFPVRDPMGYTVEVVTVPKEKPENTEWPDQVPRR